jgi:hypothetical protein
MYMKLLRKTVEVDGDFVRKWSMKSKPVLFTVRNFHDLSKYLVEKKREALLSGHSLYFCMQTNTIVFSYKNDLSLLQASVTTELITTMNGFRQSAFSLCVTVKDHDVYFHPVFPNVLHDINHNRCNIQHRTLYFFHVVCSTNSQSP